MKKILFISFLYLGAVTMLVMSMHFFQHEVSGIFKSKSIASEAWFRWSFKSHILFGIIAIFTGPVQFLEKFRNKYLNVHRKIGYIYFCSVMISSVAGLIIAMFAMGGWISTIGFTLLAIAWFTSAILALSAVKKRKIILHKKWMFISYGLTFASIPQRTMLLFAFIPGIEFITVYQCSAWFPWILNSIIAFFLFKRSVLGAS